MSRQLSHWSPLADFVSLREAMDHLFEESVVRPSSSIPRRNGEGNGHSRSLMLPVDIYETPEAHVIRAYVPGVKPDEVEITIQGDTLTIHGALPVVESEDQTRWHHRELRVGGFSRTITLPEHVDSSKAEADFENGLLTLRVPKAEESKPRTIEVKVKG